MPLRPLPLTRIGCLAGLGLSVLLPGCRSPSRVDPPAPPPAVVPPTAPAEPVPAWPALPAAPEPVYRNPRIGMVTLRAHQDADGRLLGPQVMYQVVDPGGWNVDAVDRGHGYIPSVNVEVPPGQVSPYVVPARGLTPLAPSDPLLDPAAAAEIVISGLLRPDDQPAAEGLARRQGAGWTAVYDEQAGWLLLPPAPRP